MRAIPAVAVLSLLIGCSTFRGEQHPIFGDYRPVSTEGKPLPELWSFMSLEEDQVLRLEPDGTVVLGNMRFWNLSGGAPSGEVLEGVFQGEYTLVKSQDSQPGVCVWIFSAHFDAWAFWAERHWEGTLRDGLLTVRTGEAEATFQKRR